VPRLARGSASGRRHARALAEHASGRELYVRLRDVVALVRLQQQVQLLTELVARSSTCPVIDLRSRYRSNGADITRSGQRSWSCASEHGVAGFAPLGGMIELVPAGVVAAFVPAGSMATRRQAAAASASLLRAPSRELFERALCTV
jgi:hypothetical protein